MEVQRLSIVYFASRGARLAGGKKKMGYSGNGRF